jgi:heptosyltransferase-2
MGDIILTTPALAALKAHYPRAHLDFVVKERYQELLRDHQLLDGLYLLSPSDGLLSLGRQLRRQRYDIVLDLHGNLRSRFVTVLLPASMKLRYGKRILRRWAMVRGGYRPSGAPHVVDRYLECLRPLGIRASRDRPRLYLSGDDLKFREEFSFQHRLGVSRPLVGLHPGARWPGKRWPAERFARLGRELREKGNAEILVFGGPQEEDSASWVADEIGQPAQLASALSLGQLMALISGCDLFVTNDSGPMHLATALGVPVVAIFGPTHPMLGFWPLGEEDAILTAGLSCSPCSLHGKRPCPRRNWRCLEEIHVQDVLRAALGILDHRSRSVRGRKNSTP